MIDTKKILLKKVLFAIIAILLVFAVVIILSYETSYKHQTLINNNKILTLTNDSIIEINMGKEPINNINNNQETNYSQINSPNDINQNLEPNNEDNYEEEQNNQENIYGDITLEIIPIQDNKLTGFVQINILTYPYNTDEILFMIYPKNSSNPIEDKNTLIDIIEKPFQLEFAIDSAEFENGEYILTVASTNDEASEENPWISIYKKEVIIEN